MKKQQSGFTLVELVAVIVLLGILSVVALPRFVNLQSDARIAVLSGINGAVKGANVQIYAKSLISGVESIDGDDASNPQIDRDGDGADDTAVSFGYVETTALGDVIDLDASLVIAPSGGGAAAAGDTTIMIGYDTNEDGDVVDDECYVTYTEAADAATPATISTTDTDNC